MIEDDAGMRDSLQELLSSENFECSVAENAEKGLAMARAEDPQLVVMDIQLPDMSGFQLCQTLKRDPALHRVAVVMISGRFTEPEDRIQGFELGADEYFAKPFDPVLFVARVRSILRGVSAARHTSGEAPPCETRPEGGRRSAAASP